MDRATERYFVKGLAESIQRAYKSAQKKYIAFCGEHKLTAVPASELVLCRYVSFLAKANLKYRTIGGVFPPHHRRIVSDPFLRE